MSHEWDGLKLIRNVRMGWISDWMKAEREQRKAAHMPRVQEHVKPEGSIGPFEVQGLLFGFSPPVEPGSAALSRLSAGVRLPCKDVVQGCLVEKLSSPACCWHCLTLPGDFFSFTMNEKMKSNSPPCAPAQGRHLRRQNKVYPVTCIWLESNKGMLTDFCFCKTKHMQQ